MSRFHDVGTAESVPLAGGLAPDNHGQRNADVLAADGGDVPLIGIGHVTEHDLLHIHTLAFIRRHGCADGKKEG